MECFVFALTGQIVKISKESFKQKYLQNYFVKKNDKSAGYKNNFLKIIEIEQTEGKIECYYSGKKFDKDNHNFNKSRDKDLYFNCEHIWPQSRFGSAKSKGAKYDMHHIAPTESQINAKRGNNKFGEATEETEISVLKKNRFEVRDKFKGNIARAVFYFSVMYDLPIDEDEEKELRKWNQIDPPDFFEKKRNNEVLKIQGNLNIFIEKPALIETIEDF
ncbi:MAG TPA: endonuclease [bacterium]|nr:endonuclease [bacterium]